ncbi:MAG: hypothetical protein JO112_17230 [Planctomycetes bacterium]|nr:hypothetical protein [Planctomycetota bacterium]
MRKFLFICLLSLCLSVPGFVLSQPSDCLDITVPPTADLPAGLQFPAVASNLPLDVTFATQQTVENDQKAFDLFSWASFIALNWPADPNGQPLAGKISDHPEAPRVWETYIASSQVFKKGGAAPDPWRGESSITKRMVPNAKPGQKVLFSINKNVLSDILQAGFGPGKFPPITDVNGMYAFYEIHMNKTEYDYIVANTLYNKEGQSAFLQLPKTVDFPRGSASGNKPGSIEVKAVWKQLGQGEDQSKYYTVMAIRIDPVTQQPSAQPLPFGLVGLHIVTRTEKAPQWIWSTFEHVENAPDVGETALKNHYNFNDPTKTQPATGFNFQPPNTNPVPNPTTPTQITRVLNNALLNAPWTKALNAKMQENLANTVWANYRLVTTQWPSPSGQFIPCHVTNTVAETYIQANAFSGSCMRCHNVALTSGLKSNQQPGSANFSYLLQMAQPHTGH